MKSKTSYRMLLTCILVSSLILFNGCGHKDEGDEHAGHGNEAEERHGEHGNGHEEGVHEGEGHDEHEEGVVALTKKAAEMISLKLDSVEKRVIKKKLPITGEISRDFEKSFHVSAEVPGVITRLKARLGDNVQKGSVLAEVKSRKDGKIRQVKAPGGCQVVGVNVAEGDKVDAITALFTVAYLHKLKASFDIYEKDLSLVRKGQIVKVETAAYPGKKYTGVIMYISPRVDEHTRTIKIRVDIENHDHSLKLGMFVNGSIYYTSSEEYLAVPNSALLDSGGEKIVFVPIERNEYIAKEVELGLRGVEYSQVISGLIEGERVVTGGGFYLKSELQKSSFGDGHAGH